MKPLIGALGAALLALGFALILISPMFVSASLYKAEASAFAGGASAANLSSIYKTVSSSIDQTEWIAIAGAVLAPVGGAIMVYALASTKSSKDVSEPTPSTMQAGS